MSDNPTGYPREAIQAYLEKLLKEGALEGAPVETPEDAALALGISFSETALNVRDMAGYLEFIDRVYGRIVADSLRSYAQRPDEQIKVSAFRSGSLEMVFQEVLANMDTVSATILIGLMLKYLPAAIESLAAAYKDYEEARLIRLLREQLRKEMLKDESMKALDSKDLEELSEYIDSIYQIEARNMPKMLRFSEDAVEGIQFWISQLDTD